jgi:hypothetical protein
MSTIIKDVWNVLQAVVGCVIIWKATGNIFLAIGIFGVFSGIYGKMMDLEGLSK